MNRPAVRLRKLRKVFRPRTGFFRRGAEKVAVDDVDLEVEAGELFVLLGKNGAGKTTLVKMLATLVLPTSGEAEVFGHDVEHQGHAVRRRLGLATPDERSFYWRLTGRANLEFFAALHGLHGRARRQQIDELAERLDMTEFIERRFDGYSSGMKQRMSLARSLLGDPDLVILDEPTRSLDPEAQARTCEVIRRLRDRHTVLLVTHQLEEARDLGDRIGLMTGGKLSIYQRDEVDLASLFTAPS